MAATGAWVAVSDDRTELALFSSEINAWRWGGPKKMLVVQWPFGQSLDEALATARAEAVAPAKDWVEKPLAAGIAAAKKGAR